jgi:hypothetical protein
VEIYGIVGDNAAAVAVRRTIRTGRVGTDNMKTFLICDLRFLIGECHRGIAEAGKARTFRTAIGPVKPSQTKSNQVKPGQTKSNQVKPSQTKILCGVLPHRHHAGSRGIDEAMPSKHGFSTQVVDFPRIVGEIFKTGGRKEGSLGIDEAMPSTGREGQFG